VSVHLVFGCMPFDCAAATVLCNRAGSLCAVKHEDAAAGTLCVGSNRCMQPVGVHVLYPAVVAAVDSGTYRDGQAYNHRVMFLMNTDRSRCRCARCSMRVWLSSTLCACMVYMVLQLAIRVGL
jgi:hypothetical protein